MNHLKMFTILNQRIEDIVKGELEPVKVAVLDSGIDATHPDLADRIDKAFLVNTVKEVSTINDASIHENNDRYGHGTGVASIIASTAPNSQLVDIGILGEYYKHSGYSVVEGLRYAVEQNYPVINICMALTSKFSQLIFPLCEQAYYQGQIIVTSKRNMPLVDFGFPAEFTSCISVDASSFKSAYDFTYQSENVIEFTAHGENVSVAASGGGYTSMSGTSFATPAISGICALLLGAYPKLRPFEVKSLLKGFAIC